MKSKILILFSMAMIFTACSSSPVQNDCTADRAPAADPRKCSQVLAGTKIDHRTGQPILSMSGNEHSDPATADEFRKWPKDDRQEMYDSPVQTFRSLIPEGLNSKAPIFKKVVSDFKSHLSNIDIEVNHGQVTIGGLIEKIEVVKHRDGTVLGGMIRLRQEGAQYPEAEYNDRPSHFETKVEAEAAGAEDSDVSWETYGVFEINADGSMTWLKSQDHMEWTGH